MLKTIILKKQLTYCLNLVVCTLMAVSVASPTASAISKGGCIGAAVAEYFVPGLGYGISRQWDKAVVFGGGRLIAANHYIRARESEYYQKDANDIYERTSSDDSDSGKEEIIVRMNRETWDAQYWGNHYGNMLFLTWWDLYEHGCQDNTDTYTYLLAPFRFDEFYNKWQFWVPMLVLLGNYSVYDDYYKVDYYLYRGLTESDLRQDTFPEYYMVGVGEEMLFRGVIQNYLFNTMKDSWSWSPSLSRHMSILGASTIFALAHSGAGFTANPGTAFLFGLYEGYVYHPSIEEFDLITAIAVHAWWDIIISYTILNKATFHENKHSSVPVMRIGFRF